MTEEDAFDELSDLAAADRPPCLTARALTRILNRWKRFDTWAASTAVAFGDKYAPTAAGRNGRLYQVSQAGMTNGTEPTWGNTCMGQTIEDGTVLWVDIGVAPKENYDLAGAANEAWLLKAAKAAQDVDTSYGDEKEQASQRHEQCLKMAAHFAPAFIV